MKTVACFILLLLLAQSATALNPCQRTWTRVFGSSKSDYPNGIVFGSSNRIYVAGRSSDAFDGYTNAGLSDAYLTLYARDGQRLWTRMWGTANSESCSDVVADPNGNAYVVGNARADFHGQTLVGETDLFVSKYNSNGDRAWTRFRGSDKIEQAYSASMGTGGVVHVGGFTYGDFDGQTNTAADEYDCMLCTFDLNGTHVWTRIWGSPTSELVQDTDTTPDGAIYATGFTDGAFDGEANLGSNDAFITKLDSAGTRQWTRIWGSYGNEFGRALVADDGDAVYVAGDSLAAFDGQTNAGGYDAFLTKFNSSGDRLWSRVWGGGGNDYARSIGLLPDGHLVVAGSTYGAFDGQTNAGSQDVFVSVFSTNGSYMASCIWGGVGTDIAYDLAVNPDGEIALAGIFYDRFDCQTNIGGADIFVSAYLNVAPPVVSITTTPFWVDLPFATATIAGTNSSGIAAGGTMWWENTSTSGVSGSLVAPVSRAWSIADIPLTMGTNIIAVTGTNVYGFCTGDTIAILLEVPEPGAAAAATVICALLRCARRRTRQPRGQRSRDGARAHARAAILTSLYHIL